MANNVMDSVEQRTNLAFSNQMEMLTFFLLDNQLYSINVFKILSIIRNPGKFTRMPGSHPSIIGSITFQGKVVPVIDLSVRLELIDPNHQEMLNDIIICEYNNAVQGFLVKQRQALLTRSWKEIYDPRAGGLQEFGYLTAIAYDNTDVGIQILNVEDILNDMFDIDNTISEQITADSAQVTQQGLVMAVDDSKTARLMIQSILEQLNVKYIMEQNAVAALDTLRSMAKTGELSQLRLILSDIEMPDMDGFTFTRTVKKDPQLANIPLILHSSMSNTATQIKSEEVGSDDFLSKFNPDTLAETVLKYFNTPDKR
ncbi:chemotaxis protein [Magnetococcales bacterium HHB-1]